MKSNCNKHSFHIPVMGIGYTIDTPVKVAHLGISSVLSLVDDILLEKMREFYCKKFNKPFEPIQKNQLGSRSQRITEYLNLLDQIVKEKVEDLKNSIHKKSDELNKYFDLLPSLSTLKKEFNEKLQSNIHVQELKNWIGQLLRLLIIIW